MRRFLFFLGIAIILFSALQKAVAQANQTATNSDTNAVVFQNSEGSFHFGDDIDRLNLSGEYIGNSAGLIVVNTNDSDKPHIGDNETPPTIVVSTATGNLMACAGTASASPYILQFTVSGNNLTNNIIATAPASCELSLTAVGGYGSGVTLSQTGGNVANTVIYVRSAATAPAGNIFDIVVLSSPGAGTQEVGVAGTVNVLPIVNTITNQTVINGAATTAVNFTGTVNAFTWVNDTPGIGLAASGTGNIPSFTAVNTGSAPVKATITVTPAPQPSGFAYIADFGSDDVDVINTTTNDIVAAIPVGTSPTSAVVNPDGSRVYVINGYPYSISVINTVSNSVITTIPMSSLLMNAVVSPDGSRLYATNFEDNTIIAINTSTNTIVSTIPVMPNPYCIAVSADGSRLYVTYGGGGAYVTVIDVPTSTVVANIPVDNDTFGVSASPDGSKVYIANHTKDIVSVITTSTNSVTTVIPVGGAAYGLTVSPDGSRVYVANEGKETVTVINTATNTIVTDITGIDGAYGISLNPDGSLLYVTCVGGANVAAISTLTNTLVTNINVGQDPFSFNNFVTEYSGCIGVPIKFTITVNPTAPIIITGAVTGSISACSGNASASPDIEQFTVSGQNLTGNITATAPAGFEISLAAASGYGSSLTLNQTGGSVNSTIIYVRSAASLPAGTTTGDVMVTSPGATEQDVPVTGMVNQTGAPSVVISASSNNVCLGELVTFTAVPTNGGTAPVYQWLLNGGNAGTNSATFSSNSLANGDVITCKMTVNALCIAPSDATSNSITMTVSQQVTPSVSITASGNNICAGTPVTFTATATNGGSSPVYQWLVNGSDAGTNSPIFNSSTLADGDIVSCLLMSSSGCAIPANTTSNSITMMVNPLPTVDAGGGKTINDGSSTKLNATATGNITDITWSPATGLSNNKILDPIAGPTSTTKYTLTVTTATGCSATDTLTVTVFINIIIPNTFTPNGDGINDTWNIKYLDAYPDCTVKIFDRYGQRVFSSIGYGEPWDGKYSGANLPQGTYYYIIQLKNGSKTLTGPITIVR